MPYCLAQPSQRWDQCPAAFSQLVHRVEHQHKLPPPLQHPRQVHAERAQVLRPRIRPPVGLLIVVPVQRIEGRCDDALEQMARGDAFAHADDAVRQA